MGGPECTAPVLGFSIVSGHCVKEDSIRDKVLAYTDADFTSQTNSV